MPCCVYLTRLEWIAWAWGILLCRAQLGAICPVGLRLALSANQNGGQFIKPSDPAEQDGITIETNQRQGRCIELGGSKNKWEEISHVGYLGSLPILECLSRGTFLPMPDTILGSAAPNRWGTFSRAFCNVLWKFNRAGWDAIFQLLSTYWTLTPYARPGGFCIPQRTQCNVSYRDE